MKRCSVLIALLATVWVAGASGAAELARDYVLRPTDTIAIVVWDHPEFSVESVQVRPDGKVTHPFLGDITAAGKTPSKLSSEIRLKLKSELKQPIVQVLVLDFMTNQYFVVGAVTTPGVYKSPEPLTVRQAIAQAGGTSPSADLQRAVVIGRDGTRRMVELEGEMGPQAGVDKTLIRAGDTLVIAERLPQRVAIQGAVKKPGIYEIPVTGLQLCDLVALAEGLLPEADAEGARFSRRNQATTTIDLSQVIDNRGHPANVSLQDGDGLVVPTAIPWTISVQGEVSEPGVRPLVKGKAQRVSDAIAMAGGLKATADGAKATLMRADGSQVSVDLSAILDGGALQADLSLQPNDSLFVPRLPDYVVLGSVRTPGRFPLLPGTGIAGALATAGGLTVDPARGAAVIIHADGTSTDIDLIQVLSNAVPQADVKLARDDTVVVKALEIAQVTILGPVQQPGPRPLNETPRVAELVAAAGPTPDAGSSAALVRMDGTTRTLDLTNHADMGTPLADRDILIVTDAVVQVAVMGAVRTPGRYPMKAGDRFSDAIAIAGDVTELADRQSARLLRRSGETILVNVSHATAGKDPVANPQLQEGDTVVIEKALWVTVLGEVKAPQKMIWEDGERVSDAIAKAGGLTAEADRYQATVIRADSTVIDVDLAAILGGNEQRANIALQGGDTLLIASSVQGYVAVLGAVQSPGRYATAHGERFSGIVARAGGLVDNAGALKATLMHAGGTTVTVDVQAVLDHPGTADDPTVLDGDILVVSPTEVITVTGAVKAPGRFPLQGQNCLSAVIASAQGATPTGDLEHVGVIRSDGERLTVNLKQALETGDRSLDIELRAGDIVTVPDAAYHVSILGTVTSPGQYPITSSTRIADVLAAAGGLREGAAPGSCQVLRGTGAVAVQLERLLVDKMPEENILLQDGDTIMVESRAPAVITVLGEVVKSGNFPLQAGSRLSRAIAQAEGFSEKADTARVQLVRGGGQQDYDLTPMLRGESITQDPEIQDGDLIVVPEAHYFVTILGVVEKPGVYQFRPGATVLEAVAGLGGGWKEKQSAPNRTILSRKVGDQVGVAELDLLAVTKTGDFKANPTLEDGDIIYVPQVSQNTLKGIMEILFPVASVFRLFGLD